MNFLNSLLNHPTGSPEPDWGTAYALGLASKLAYRDDQVIRQVAVETWGFSECQILPSETRVFVASTPDVLLVSFRGSATVEDWKLNARFPMEAREYFSLHEGFFRAFCRVHADLESQLAALAKPPKRCFFTGHSLGGALASIAAYYFKDFLPEESWIYTYGQPCPGDQRFADAFNTAFEERCFRIVNEDDLVTRLPPGYTHVERRYRFAENAGLTRSHLPALPETLSQEEFERRERQILAELHADFAYEGETPAQTRTLLGITEHSLDAYLSKVGKQISMEEGLAMAGDRSVGLLPPLLPVGAADPDASSESADEDEPGEDHDGQDGAEDQETAETLDIYEGMLASDEGRASEPPVAVHIVWGHGSTANAIPVAESIFEFLSHVPGQLDLEEGVGIPVYTGHHFKAIRAKIDRLTKDGNHAHRGFVVVPILDIEGTVDPEFKEFVTWLFAKAADANDQNDPRLLVVPVSLGSNWDLPNHLIASKPQEAAWDVGVALCRRLVKAMILAKTDGAITEEMGEAVKAFISFASVDEVPTNNLAREIAAHLSKGLLKAVIAPADFQKGDGLTQIDEHQRSSLTLVVRTDHYPDSPWCQKELLAAKRSGKPIVTVQVLVRRERRSLSFGGNTITIGGQIDSTELIELCRKVCLQQWLRYLHFLLRAPVVYRRYKLEIEPVLLARPPELLDFANQTLDGKASQLVLYPDPPLPVSETDLIRRAYPRSRFATPTTLSSEALRRVPTAPLNGLQIALSLSESAEDLAETLEGFRSGLQGHETSGLFAAHLNHAIAYLTLTLIRAGAKLGYGGHLGEQGYTRMLSDFEQMHRRTRSDQGGYVLYSYVAAWLWDLKPPTANRIHAQFERIPAGSAPGALDPVGRARELSQMRKVMAQKTDARVILGGRRDPKLPDLKKDGYAGRLPGQAEEAILHLIEGKPLFVAGGFYGVSGLIAKALCNKLDGLPTEEQWRQQSPDYAAFCDAYDQNPPNPHAPKSLDELWRKFAEFGEGFFWNTAPEKPTKWPDNGLTAAQNLALFEAVLPDEISFLVMQGLERVVDHRNRLPTSPLNVAFFNGSLADVLDVEAYAVLVLPSAKLQGADRALDERLNGAIAQRLESKTPERIVKTNDRLLGDWVIVQQISEPTQDQTGATSRLEALKAQIRKAIHNIAKKAKDHRIRSLAVVPFGVNFGLSPEESVELILTTFQETRRISRIISLAICEIDPSRYAAIVGKARSLAPHGDPYAITELIPSLPPEVRSPLYLHFTASAVSRGDFTLEQFARGPKGEGAVAQESVPVSIETIRNLVDPNRNRPPLDPQKDRPPAFGDHPRIGKELANLVLTPSVRKAIENNRGLAWDILHDVSSSIIPFEMIAQPDRPWAALDPGVRRGLLDRNLPVFEPYVSVLPLSLLIIANPTGDLEGTIQEAEAIEKGLKAVSGLKVTTLIGPKQASLSAVRKELKKRYDFVHYAGHGNFDVKQPEQTGLILADRKVLTADGLMKMDLDHVPMLVVLNACESGIVENTLVGASLAHQILRTGVKAFLANRWVVGDTGAATFAITLYQTLAQGKTLGVAVRTARQKLYEMKDSDWVNYALYGSAEVGLNVG
jgi:triacylglycerol lipase